jgi:hypothetical protein
MERKTVIGLLIKLFPLYVAVLLLWQYVGISRVYHELIALVLGTGYALFDPQGLIKGIDVREGEFLVKLLAGGKKLPLFITAEDLTSNMAMLLTLYGASPFRGRCRMFARHLLISLGILFAIHVFTLAAQIQYALMSNETTARLHPPNSFLASVIPIYMNFYTLFGMYLFILGLWLPFIMSVVMRHKREAAGQP